MKIRQATAFLFVVFAGFACRSFDRAPASYPSEWWKPVPKANAASWEILPQEAKPGEVILSKRNELGILSNFAATPFEYHGQRYASVEGFWQMLKYPEDARDERARGATWPQTRSQVASMSAFEAKHAGDEANQILLSLKIDWVTFGGKRLAYREKAKGEFYRLIWEVEWAKVTQNPAVKDVLLRTGDLRLLPDHHQGESDPPAWRYFEIWMEIRDRLRARHAL